MSPAPVQSSGQEPKKRKQAATNDSRSSKRAKITNARKISVQTSDKAFSNGNLNVDTFVKAREYEIKALEVGMRRSKQVLSSRAFQDVPKDLRRRTASHNVKKVPKRLRKRAAREMIEDNTPTVTSRRRKPTPHQRLRLETAKRLQNLSAKSKARRQENKTQKLKMTITVTGEGEKPVESTILAPKLSVLETAATVVVNLRKPRIKKSKLKSPATPIAKFRKRQINKTWLPTHLFHSKRAHMTPPREPLWRFALPLTPTNKSYRIVHRATTQRGAVAWDTSYMSTIGLEGPEKSIEGLLKALGFGADEDFSSTKTKAGMKWRRGTRVGEGWLHEREAWPSKGITPATVIWGSENTADGDIQMQNAERTMTSKKKARRKLFIRLHPAGFMQLWEQVIRLAKVQKPSVTVEDLRFEIGSIDISGPNATEALVGALQPREATENSKNRDSAEQIWRKLAFQTPASLPPHSVLSFEVSDPRLHHPPRTVPSDGSDCAEQIIRILSTWPLDRTPKAAVIFERSHRLRASRSLASQKSINRRKTLAPPGTYPNPRQGDPQIPVLLFASRANTNSSGTWTLLLPWKCVPPVWNSIMYYPLSTGGSVRFGGLQQKRQIAFESGVPWFPGDYPGVDAGDQWEVQEQLNRKREWEKKPKGRRIEWESVDLGMGRKGEIGVGWACDWQRLVSTTPEQSDAEPQLKAATVWLPRSLAGKVLSGRSTLSLDAIHLTTIKITMITRGVPQTCARIYRLPAGDNPLRDKWLAQLPTPTSKKAQTRRARFPKRPEANAPEALHRAYLAASILTSAPLRSGELDYPCVPGEEDLIGFVTSGNFNLGEGKGIGIGSICLSRVMRGTSPSKDAEDSSASAVPVENASAKRTSSAVSKDHMLCVVRDAGHSIGKLARWELA